MSSAGYLPPFVSRCSRVIVFCLLSASYCFGKKFCKTFQFIRYQKYIYDIFCNALKELKSESKIKIPMAGYLSSCTLFLRRCSKYANSRFLYNIKSREVATRAIVKGNATEAYSLLWTSPILCVRVKRMSFTNVLFRPTTQDSVLCWKCGDMINLNQDLFCNSCEVVQKPSDDVNYFEILSVEKQFDLDAKELTKKFRLLQMQLHPDRFTQKSEVSTFR